MPALLVALAVGASTAGVATFLMAPAHIEAAPDGPIGRTALDRAGLPGRGDRESGNPTDSGAPTVTPSPGAPTASATIAPSSGAITTTPSVPITPTASGSTGTPGGPGGGNPGGPGGGGPGTGGPGTGTRDPTATPTSTAPVSTNPAFANQVLSLVNNERRNAGCGSLTIDPRLNQAAQAHSTDMATRRYFSHTGLNGSSFVDRAEAAGYWTASAENIAQGQTSAASAMSAWMGSASHRANILNCAYRNMGLGFADNGSQYGTYWTQMFGW